MWWDYIAITIAVLALILAFTIAAFFVSGEISQEEESNENDNG